MSRLRSLIGQSPAIAIASAALVMSVAGGATAATVAHESAASGVTWHKLTLLNGWKYGLFNSFHAAYYVDSNHVVHLRGGVRTGLLGKPVFRLPAGVRPSHPLSMTIYASNAPAEMNILPGGQVIVFNPTGSSSNVTDFSSFDGISFPLG